MYANIYLSKREKEEKIFSIQFDLMSRKKKYEK